MHTTDTSLADFLDAVTPPVRRRDAETLIEVMSALTGRSPRLWGTIIGFGACHYRYPTGNQGEMPLLSFSPRKGASTIYLIDGVAAHEHQLAALGPHTTGAGCLYLKDLGKVDLAVLREILDESMAFAIGGGSELVTITVTD